MEQTEVIIVGGGLAGMAAGIHLAITGFSVVIIEKNAYPHHKVCGEYLSNEVVPYLDWLGIDVSWHNPPFINRFNFSQAKGKEISADLPIGGIGISRFVLDNLLYQRALQAGCKVLKDTVRGINYKDGRFLVESEEHTLNATLVLGAFGKWSNVDRSLSRRFAGKTSQWVAVKAHYSADWPENEVSLYSFPGGYCGVSKVEDSRVNICYLASSTSFRKHRNIAAYQKTVLFKNARLREVLLSSEKVFEKPVAISRISFEEKNAVEGHILMIGDSAGLIHPLCGNGMAMALHSAKIASELSISFLNNTISRDVLENKYAQQWKKHFGKRLFAGRVLARIIVNPVAARTVFMLLRLFPSLLRAIIRLTHGKIITTA